MVGLSFGFGQAHPIANYLALRLFSDFETRLFVLDLLLRAVANIPWDEFGARIKAVCELIKGPPDVDDFGRLTAVRFGVIVPRALDFPLFVTLARVFNEVAARIPDSWSMSTGNCAPDRSSAQTPQRSCCRASGIENARRRRLELEEAFYGRDETANDLVAHGFAESRLRGRRSRIPGVRAPALSCSDGRSGGVPVRRLSPGHADAALREANNAKLAPIFLFPNAVLPPASTAG